MPQLDLTNLTTRCARFADRPAAGTPTVWVARVPPVSRASARSPTREVRHQPAAALEPAAAVLLGPTRTCITPSNGVCGVRVRARQARGVHRSSVPSIIAPPVRRRTTHADGYPTLLIRTWTPRWMQMGDNADW